MSPRGWRISEAGEADATLLAAAGLDRLGMCDIGHAIPVEIMLPAASQGAVGIDRLTGRNDLQPLLEAINDGATYAAVMAERALLEALGGNCHSPIAALARREGDQMRLTGQILTGDGSAMIEGETFFADDGQKAASGLAADLLNRATPELRAAFNP